MDNRPQIAVIDPNTLAVLGLKNILLEVMPFASVETFGSFAELSANEPDHFFHYFVSMDILLSNRGFFAERRGKTIALTLAVSASSQLTGFHCLCVNVPEQQLIKSLLTLEQKAHANGRNLPPLPQHDRQSPLSDREIEVMALVARGFINKEIADRLSISLSTVVTHRKNIMDKLGIRSVSALTIFAVTHGYVDINKI